MPPFTDSFFRALADYRILFPNLDAIGSGASLWLAEYNRVRSPAFGSTLITSGSFEGGTSSGLRNFSQETLIDALHVRRAELAADYTIPEHLAGYATALFNRAASSVRGGSTVIRFSP